MEKLCLYFVLAIFSNGVLGLSFRNKRQMIFEEDNDIDDEDDRNEWNIPSRLNRPGGGRFPQFPRQFPCQFPGQFSCQFPGHQTNPIAPTTVPTSNINGATTQSSTVQDCIRTCPVTSEYNPVCGSNGVTYDNPSRLLCAQACGVTLNLLRSSRCPSSTVAPVS